MRNINPRPSKKKSVPASTEMRFLVTVLMGFSSEQFGGPEAVVELADDECRDSGADEDGKKGCNPVAEAGLAMISRASTRATRAAVARDDCAPALAANAGKARASAPVVDGGAADALRSETPESDMNGAAARKASDTAVQGCFSLPHAAPARMDSASAITADVEAVSAIGGFVASTVCVAPVNHIPQDDLSLPNMGGDIQQMGTGSAPKHTECYEATPSAKGSQDKPHGVNGTQAPAINDQCKCSSADVQISPHEAHAYLSNAAHRPHEMCAGEASRGAQPQGDSSMLSRLGERHTVALGSCLCAGSHSSDGCINLQAPLKSTDGALYSEELQAVLSNPSSLSIHLRPPPAELIVMAGTTSVRISRLARISVDKPSNVHHMSHYVCVQVAEFKRAISVALRETYHIFSKFQVMWVHCPALCSNTASSSRSVVPSPSEYIPFVCGHMPADKDKIERHLPYPADSPVRCCWLNCTIEM